MRAVYSGPAVLCVAAWTCVTMALPMTPTIDVRLTVRVLSQQFTR